MRQGEEDRVHLVSEVAVEGEGGRGEVGVHRADRIVVAVAPGEADQRDRWVAVEEPDQFAADIPRRPDDTDPDPASGGGIRPAVRRDRGRRLEPRAHRRAGARRRAASLTGDEVEDEDGAIGRTAAITA